MIDDDEDDIATKLTVAVEYDTQIEANDAGADLVIHGIGATVVPIPADELDEDDPKPGYRVLVLRHELQRAQEILGIVEPEERPEANPEEPMKLEKNKDDWKMFALIWVAAMIIIPGVAFLASYYLFSR